MPSEGETKELVQALRDLLKGLDRFAEKSLPEFKRLVERLEKTGAGVEEACEATVESCEEVVASIEDAMEEAEDDGEEEEAEEDDAPRSGRRRKSR